MNGAWISGTGTVPWTKGNLNEVFVLKAAVAVYLPDNEDGYAARWSWRRCQLRWELSASLGNATLKRRFLWIFNEALRGMSFLEGVARAEANDKLVCVCVYARLYFFLFFFNPRPPHMAQVVPSQLYEMGAVALSFSLERSRNCSSCYTCSSFIVKFYYDRGD